MRKKLGPWSLAAGCYISCPLFFFHPIILVFMTVRQLLALASLSFVAMSNSCKKEDDVVPCNAAADVTATHLAGFVPRITEPVPNVGQTNEYVVNSAAEYRALFAGKVLPPVDFATHTLLAGKTRTASGGHVLAQQVAQTCTGYTYTVQLAAGASPAPCNVVHYVLLPKLPLAATITFDVQLLPTGTSQAAAPVPTAK